MPDTLVDEGLICAREHVVYEEGEGGVFVSSRFGERHQVNDLGLLVWEEPVERFAYSAGYLGGALTIVRDFVCDMDYQAWAWNIKESVNLCFLAIVHVPQAVVAVAIWKTLLGPGS